MTSNGKHAESSLPPPDSADLVLDAWREALGETLGQERASWARERALIEAQAAQTIAELRATIVEMRAEQRRVHRLDDQHAASRRCAIGEGA